MGKLKPLPLYKLLEAECQDKIINGDFDSLDRSHFDSALNTADINRLGFIIEHTGSMLVQDYVQAKINFLLMEARGV